MNQINKLERLKKISENKTRYVIGLMSGTSVDGIDAALVKIDGSGLNTKITLIDYLSVPFSQEVKDNIFELFRPSTGSVDKICSMNFLLGELFAKAAIDVTIKAGFTMEQIDIIGSHGQTIYHIPDAVELNGYNIKSTLQIGEPSVIAERTGVLTVADFRTRDMAAGGQGAPLVPYADYLMYRQEHKTIALQNIGGISNMTVLPKGLSIEDIVAFDNGPGNMIIDEVIRRLSNGKENYDKNGRMAALGRINNELLNKLMEDPYFKKSYPKTTGREYFGSQYVDNLMKYSDSLNIKSEDLMATVTAFTAKAIESSYRDFIIPKFGLDSVIIGGGGSYNPTLINMLRNFMPEIQVMTQEDIGFSSEAKEAVDFAILANEVLSGNTNNVPSATGALKPVIMGKIIL